MTHGRSCAFGALEAGGGWTPLVPATPILWLDATYGITLTSGVVSTWSSRTGGIGVTQGVGAARPDYSTTAWNGAMPGVVFGEHNGVGGYTDLRSSDTTLANLWNTCTVLATLRYNADSATQFLLFVDNGSTSPFGYGLNSSNQDRLDLHAGGADITGSTITTGNYRLFFGRKRAAPTNQSSFNLSASLNDTSDGTDTNANNIQLTIGGQSLIGTNKLHATVAELIIYNGYYPDAAAKYYAYSKVKWGG